MLEGLAKPEALLRSYEIERLDHIRKLTVSGIGWYSGYVLSMSCILVTDLLYPPWRSHL